MIQNGSTPTGNYNYGETITLKATIKTGYTWEKWTSTNASITDKTEKEITFKMPAGNVTMTPVATENKYTIHLDNQEATTSGTTEIYQKYDTGIYLNQECTEDKKMTTTQNAIQIPQKTGYDFKGYYTEPNGQGSQMITETGYKTILLKEDSNTENSTLYAQWIAKKDTAYKVEYYQMGLDGRYPEIATETENKTGETNQPSVSEARTYNGALGASLA